METRYNWDEFPEWANFAATDPYGDIFVSEIQPELKGRYWAPQMKTRSCVFSKTRRERYEYIKNIGETFDWENSLEERPKK